MKTSNKILIINRVASDGMGDFFHLLGIYEYLRTSPKYHHYQFMILISCDRLKNKKESARRLTVIKNQLEESGIRNYYLGYEDEAANEFPKNREITSFAAEAIQIINISFFSVSLSFKNILNYANPNVIKKFIGEHEANFQSEVWSVHSLGLGPSCHGIKIKNYPRCSRAQAFNEIKINDAEFSQVLLRASNSLSYEEFAKKSHFITAYFSCKQTNDFKSFLYFIFTNESLKMKKSIALYLSSNHIDLFLDQMTFGFFDDFEQLEISEIKFINRDEKIIFPLNSKSDRNILIFTNFKLSNKSYDKLYQIADLAAVSGDNTLENAIAHDLFLFYCSTNFTNKSATHIAIANVIRKLEDKFPYTIYQDYLTYFNLRALSLLVFSTIQTKERLEVFEQFKQLNVIGMAEHWPIVTKHIKENYNFYNKLETIFFDGMTLNDKPLQNETVDDENTLSNLNKFSLFSLAAVSVTAAVATTMLNRK